MIPHHYSAAEVQPEALLAELIEAGRVEVDQWRLTADEDGLWATNPYGVDVALWPFDLEGCRLALAAIAADDHDREWC